MLKDLTVAIAFTIVSFLTAWLMPYQIDPREPIHPVSYWLGCVSFCCSLGMIVAWAGVVNGFTEKAKATEPS